MDLNSQANNTPIASLSYVPLLFVYTLSKKGGEKFYVEHARMGAIMSLFFLVSLLFFAFISKFLGVILGLLWAVPTFLSAARAWDRGKAGFPGLNWALQLPIGRVNSLMDSEDEDLLDKPIVSPTESKAVTADSEPTPSVEAQNTVEIINPADDTLIHTENTIPSAPSIPTPPQNPGSNGPENQPS